jgi:hypothetical protein
MAKECPCYKNRQDCPQRTSYCHGECKEFKDWRNELDVENKAKRDKNDEEYLQYVVPRIVERKKRKNEKNRV